MRLFQSRLAGEVGQLPHFPPQKFFKNRIEPLPVQPLSGELLSADQLEELARHLAEEIKVVDQPGHLQFLQDTLNRHEQEVRSVYLELSQETAGERQVTPAGEWLLDNFSLVMDQVREIRIDLPNGYYYRLPKLSEGPMAGLPRVYLLTRELTSHTDARLEGGVLRHFVLAFQSVVPLSMGELWAVAIMLRLNLVENLGGLSNELLLEISQRVEANAWANRLLNKEELEADQLVRTLMELDGKYATLPATIAIQLLRRLRDSEENTETVLQWLEEKISRDYTSNENLIRFHHQAQAARQTAVGNTITSMRTLSAIKWQEWFEQVSHVEQVLRRDPAGVYSRCTFATRDRYRHAVEEFSQRSELNELAVAWEVVNQAGRAARSQTGTGRQSHIGYYLVGAGRELLERQIGFRPSNLARSRRYVLKYPTPFYLGAIAGTGLALLAGGLKSAGVKGPRISILATSLLALPALEVAQGLVNWSISRLLKPRVLPRLDLSDGIPDQLRTIVVIPMLLLTKDSIEGQFNRLEVLYLANTDPNLHFALLSDLADAPGVEMPEDDALLSAASARLVALNQRYGKQQFLFLHRRRRWNPQQGVYMGWERKRGKLEEFNRLLQGEDTSFAVQVGDTSVLQYIHYVITLDADTQLSRDTAKELIGTIAHPLNQAVIDPITNRVVEGYGILQPRIGIDLLSATRTRFTRLFSGNVGIDPYTTAVSDVYMDLFEEGNFAGKGIYDPAVLFQVLHERFPENALLSHDLLEGNYARAGFLSDIELLDNYPSTYAAYSARGHRWIRGDWQIAPWLLPQVPGPYGTYIKNVLPVIARFKIADNLRRSLTPPAIVALLAAGWLILPGSKLVWSILGLIPLALPAILGLVEQALFLFRSEDPFATLLGGMADHRLRLFQLGVNISFLLDQSVINLDAIFRTLWRMRVSHHLLLEWETAEQAQERLALSYGPVFRRMALPLSLGSLLVLFNRLKAGNSWGWPLNRSFLFQNLPVFQVISSWLTAPALAAWLEKPPITLRYVQTPDERDLLYRLAVGYWDYFKTLVTEEGHFLAPDNFQEEPHPVAAFRTSPTNIGLQLLADLAALDFGFIGLGDFTGRTEKVFETLDRLEHFRGHLLNWYDTRTLQPLPPSYVSTVDSGNLAGFLLTLHQGYLALKDRPIIDERIWIGLRVVLAALQDKLLPGDPALEELKTRTIELENPPVSLQEIARLLAQVAHSAGVVENRPMEVGVWARRLKNQAQSLQNDLEMLLPAAGDITFPAFPALAKLYGGSPLFGELTGLLSEAIRELENNPAYPGLVKKLSEAYQFTLQLQNRQAALAEKALNIALGMDYRFLYDYQRELFSIGYQVNEGRRDNSYYDLLASEARLSSFLAIAKGDVPQEHWFHLGRPLTRVRSSAALVSWTGTMFEYLMPLLVMRSYPETLLDKTYAAAIDRQISYAHQHHIPWGISESGYNLQDVHHNYQYRAFGVPGLGLKRGLAADLVVAPYATILALMVAPGPSLKNLHTLLQYKLQGRYGLYEALDFTPERLPAGKEAVIIRSYMVHHQGMSLISLDNYLHGLIMQQRFHSEPMVQATEMLLQEQFPRTAPRETLPEIDTIVRVDPAPAGATIREIKTPFTPVPYTQVLSNSSYTVIVTNAGGGVSRSENLAITRWQEDSTRDCWGSFFYIRDAHSGTTWSPAYQPTRHTLQDYRVINSLHKVEFHQQVAGIETSMEIAISAEDNAEVRHITLTNLTSAPRDLEITSYAEIVLAPSNSDEAHPAFSKLFIETEYLSGKDALLASRRPRSPQDQRLWALHVVAVRGFTSGVTEYETDRATFIGQDRDLMDPAALSEPLKSTTGPVLDPIFSLRRRVRIVPGGKVNLNFTTGLAETREQALLLVEKYHDYLAGPRVIEMALSLSQIQLRYLNINADAAHRFQRLAAKAIYLDPRARANPDIIKKNRRGQSGLWGFGISGDYPIILAHVEYEQELLLARELMQAHEYWRLKDLMIDLVFINDQATGYHQGMQDQILAMVQGTSGALWLDQPGGIHVLRADQMSEEDRILFDTVARTILYGGKGDLAAQLHRLKHMEWQPPELPVRLSPGDSESQALPPVKLVLANPYGGFSSDGTEYIINLRPGRPTPAPWSNVIANQRFGFLVTERGSGYTWSENSRENRLTPWSNDPVTDPSGEVLYLRDEDSKMVWAATPQPAGSGHFRVRHGFGYTVFEQQRHQLESRLTLFVPPEDSVKIYRLELVNHSTSAKNLSATFYVEWVLGVSRAKMAPFIITEFDQASGTLLAHNAYNNEFSSRTAFIAACSSEVNFSGDRTEFIGRNSDLSQPAGLYQTRLSGTCGGGLDPCGALQQTFTIEAGEQREIIFLLGEGTDRTEVARLTGQYRHPEGAGAAYMAVVNRWREILGKVQVTTPQPEINFLLNGWLLYQTLSCRIWGRSAFYQSGGAYGFRDQLQDIMALTLSQPGLTRDHILRSACRQFLEGDVQHWWHPPTGRGIRTNFSDDYLWLPFVTVHYLETTGDHTILDQKLPFLEGRPLFQGEAEYYDTPLVSQETGTLYEHCQRAIEHGLRFGAHNLPLMGSGDWNDGMNLVGDEGKGESVWVGWFLLINLRQMAVLARQRGDQERATRLKGEADKLIAALEQNGWDGEWYLRAFFDDGTPLGSAQNEECQIDSLSQSWAVISGEARAERTKMAMDAVEQRLVDQEAGLIKLFTPPFDHNDHNPGYIKGYLPGVRENGGQYTHGAIWVIWATALLGQGQRVGDLFDLINPILQTNADPGRYKVEPYVIAADVYSEPPHLGRGGWTWYTGSAGWLYRLGLEMLIGLRLKGDYLILEPCIPPKWEQYSIFYRHGQSNYRISVENPQGVSKGIARLEIDGVPSPDGRIYLKDDGKTHLVRVVLGVN